VSERVRGRLSDLCHTVMGVRAACCLDTMRCSATAREARFREDSFALPCGGGWMLWRTGERGCHGCHLVFLQPMTCLHAWWEGCPTGRVLGSCVRGTRTHTTHTRHTHTHARHTHTHTHTRHDTRHTHQPTRPPPTNQPTITSLSLSRPRRDPRLWRHGNWCHWSLGPFLRWIPSRREDLPACGWERDGACIGRDDINVWLEFRHCHSCV
jgi:hypothetical protein